MGLDLGVGIVSSFALVGSLFLQGSTRRGYNNYGFSLVNGIAGKPVAAAHIFFGLLSIASRLHRGVVAT